MPTDRHGIEPIRATLCRQAGTPSRHACCVFYLLAFLLLYTAWAWGGVRPSFQWVGVVAAAFLTAAWLSGGDAASRRTLRRDPVFYLGLAFLLLLVLQAVNAGRFLQFDPRYQEWSWSPPPWPGWPSAFRRMDALMMLTWFFPAWSAVMAVRSPLMDRTAVHRLLLLLAYSAGLLALFGSIQFLTRTPAIYWTTPVPVRFFASFPYANHAASYFVLSAALAAGLLYSEMFRAGAWRAMGYGAAARAPHRSRRMAALGIALVLCLLGANLTISRAGVVMAWALAVFAAAYGTIRGWRLLRPAGRFNYAAITTMSLGMFFFAVVGFGEQAIGARFAPLPARVNGTATNALWADHVNISLDGRSEYARAAVTLWRTQPWFGLGGWGYQYRIAEQLPPERWRELTHQGWANVHVDALQFLAEFGVVGFGLILAVLAVLWTPLVRQRGWNRSMCAMGTAGLTLVVFHSMVDLPFRSPAILLTWSVILAAMPKICCTNPQQGNNHRYA